MSSRRSSILVNFGPLLWEHKFSTADISHTSCHSATKFGVVRGLANRHLFPEFRKLRSTAAADHAVTCIIPSLMHSGCLLVTSMLMNSPATCAFDSYRVMQSEQYICLVFADDCTPVSKRHTTSSAALCSHWIVDFLRDRTRCTRDG